MRRPQPLTLRGAHPRWLGKAQWRDRQAVDDWRHHLMHQTAQEEGKASIFDGYRIRVAEVFKDYDHNEN